MRGFHARGSQTAGGAHNVPLVTGSGAPSTARQCITQRCPKRRAILLRAVRADELLLKTIAFDHLPVVATGEYEPIIRAKQERLFDPAECAEAGDERLLKRGHRRRGFSARREVPAEQFAGVAIHDRRWCRPAILASPHAGQVS